MQGPEGALTQVEVDLLDDLRELYLLACLTSKTVREACRGMRKCLGRRRLAYVLSVPFRTSSKYGTRRGSFWRPVLHCLCEMSQVDGVKYLLSLGVCPWTGAAVIGEEGYKGLSTKGPCMHPGRLPVCGSTALETVLI